MRLQGIRGGEVFCSPMIGSHTLSEPVRFWTVDASVSQLSLQSPLRGTQWIEWDEVVCFPSLRSLRL